MTARQLALATGISLDGCSHVLKKLAGAGLVSCENPQARRSRIYWLTKKGVRCHKRHVEGANSIQYDYSDVDLALYGWVCYAHRAIIIKCLTEPLQPAAIKRRALQKHSDVRMSANNVRDIIRSFLIKGIVQKIFVRKKAHPRYELTEMGKRFQILLNQRGW